MITTAEEYKKALYDIQQSSTVVHTTLPSTEPRVPIDLDSRKINIPDEFKFLATKKETKAETIYFICDRYFDDVDLSSKTCVIQYVNTDGKKTNYGLYHTVEIDVDSVDGKIIFGWQIQSESTQIAGEVEFAITFYEIGEDESGENVFKYNLTTLAASSLILDTLDVWNSITTPSTSPSELQIWLDKINSIAEEMKTSNNETKAKINEFNDSFNEKMSNINNTVTSQIKNINGATQEMNLHYSEMCRNLGINHVGIIFTKTNKETPSNMCSVDVSNFKYIKFASVLIDDSYEFILPTESVCNIWLTNLEESQCNVISDKEYDVSLISELKFYVSYSSSEHKAVVNYNLYNDKDGINGVTDLIVENALGGEY